LQDVREQLVQSKKAQDRLTVRAPLSGVILPPSVENSEQGSPKAGPAAPGPLDPRNLGAYLTAGTLLCLVGDPEKTEAVLLISQNTLGDVCVGQTVFLQVNQLPGQYPRGEIRELAEAEEASIPAELLAAGRLPTSVSIDGNVQPVDTYYQAIVEIPSAGSAALPGAIGRARIECSARSLAWRITRYLQRTFRFASNG
jgi:hypothetical protein